MIMRTCSQHDAPHLQSVGEACVLLQDLIARQAKFLTWYKRPGQRVLINPQGDLLVRPSFVEVGGLGGWRVNARACGCVCKCFQVRMRTHAELTCLMYLQLSIHNRPFSSSVSQHMLLSYRTSLAAVVKAQLDRRKRLHVCPPQSLQGPSI